MLAVGAIAAAIGLALPMGASALPLPITYLAPYHHVQHVPSLSSTLVGCTHDSVMPLKWSSLLGSVHWYAHTTARSCRLPAAAPGVGSSVTLAFSLAIALPIATFPGASTSTSVELSWIVSALASTSFHAGGACPAVVVNPTNGSGSEFCYLGGLASLTGEAYLLDRTNGTVYYASNYWGGIWSSAIDYNDTDCAAFHCSTLNYTYSGSSGSGLAQSADWWINTSLDHSDSYEAVTVLFGNVTAETFGFPASRASAALDLSGLTYGAALASVIVS